MNARQQYQSTLEEIRLRVAQLDRSLQQLVWARTGLFFAGLLCLLFGYAGSVSPAVTRPLGWLFAVAFLVAIVWNEHLSVRRFVAESDSKLFERLLARLDRNWPLLPRTSFVSEVDPPMSSDDLDVAGECSLLSLVSLAETPPGVRMLQEWIASVPSWAEIRKRQAAVRALAPNRSLRLSVLQRLFKEHYGSTRPYGLTRWAESPSWLSQHPVAGWLSWISPGLVVLGTAILLAGLMANSLQSAIGAALTNIGFICLSSGFLCNLVVTVLWGSWIHGIFLDVCGHRQTAIDFAKVFQWTSELPRDEGLLDQIRKVCSEQPSNACRGFRSLNRLVQLASLQRNVVLYLLYLILQLLFLWDLHVLRMLERWKNRFGDHVGEWFEALGTFEALISVSTLADEYPNWCFPAPSQDPQVAIDAKDLAHPLLPDQVRVANDLRLSVDRPILLVTGSNMAGKSTFLRAVGINLMLARTGGPVCASSLHTQAFEIASSIRVRDSLREGVSFFMAELQRLKSVVDLAEEHFNGQQAPLLFLLDEILQGTNSRERQIAVVGVVEQLIANQACGLLSTHDLDLADLPSLANRAQIVHFREFFEEQSNGKQVMRFDYRMRPGVTPTTNALKLLQLVGLGLTEPGANPTRPHP
jgi:hypothetical protein